MEYILMNLGSRKPFNKSGKLTKSGEKAYEKLLDIVAEMRNNGAIIETRDDVERYYDEVIRLD